MYRLLVWGALLLCCNLCDVRAQTEIFRNAGFEAPLGPDNWYCSGCTGEQYGGDKVEGAVSMRATQRRATWAGPAYDLAYGSDVISDRTYDFQIYVQLASGGDVKHPVKVTVRIEFSDGETFHRQLALLSDVSQTDGWQQIAATLTVPVFDKPVTSLHLYVSGPPSWIDLLVDRSSLTESGPGIVDTFAADTELLSNPGFESSLDPWECRGCTGVQYTTDCYGGASCMLAQERRADWAGPSQYLVWGTTVKAGQNYQSSIQVKLLDGGDTKYLIRAKLNFEFSDGRPDANQQVAANWISAQDGWKLLAGDYTIPALQDYGDAVSSVRFYLQGPPGEIRFLVDDASFKEFVSPTADWRAEADARIEQIRKRDVKLRVNTPNAHGITVEVAQTRSHFPFGAMVNTNLIPSNSLYNDYVFNNFEWAVIGNHLKWKMTERNEGQLTFDRAEAALSLLESRGIPVRGHNVFWGIPTHVPTWLHAYSGSELEQKCWKRVDDVVGRFAGRLVHWDVNNEMLHGNYFVERTGNPQIRYDMFQKVKEKDPGAKLFLNDYGAINSGAFTQAYVQQAEEFLANGAPVDGMGVQGHFKSRPDPVLVKSRLDLLATAGLPMWITEMTVAEQDELERAVGYEDATRVIFSHPAVEGLILWSSVGSPTFGDPLTAIAGGDNFELNEAGRRWRQLVHTDWRTNPVPATRTTTSAGQEFDFRGF
ncbi:endo-1,4-beta-xylanase 2-like, partial [Branchiostoma floridae]|uniref:Endo-1,4-beta-xylanase 2-like n=1 Tax=Branchiostoma floridae TaxID=7739 RepID=A0A9J7HUN4_BRAFL